MYKNDSSDRLPCPRGFSFLRFLLSLKGSSFIWSAIFLLCFSGVSRGAESVLISEFMANNFRTLADEDGDYPDWVELYNNETSTVNLQGWYLTDSKNNLKKWRFPAVAIPPKGYLVVFASGKDRTPAFGPLHTSFKLGSGSGYLGLVASNGVSIVSEYAPSYPAQVANVSYGFPAQENVQTLLSASAPAKFYVPVDDRFSKDWTRPEFSDAAWTASANGLGYDTDPATVITPVLLADSFREFTGIQGQSNWFYGYWDRGNDLDGVYKPGEFKAFPRTTATTLSADNFFAANTWKWFPTADAATEINRLGGIAASENGTAGRADHWAVRRWISETNGLVRIYGMLADRSRCAGTTSGDGVTGRIFVDGTEIFSQSIQNSGVGYSVQTTLSVGAVVDFVIDPGSGLSDECDNAAFTALIMTESPTFQLLADSAADWSAAGDQGENSWQYGYYDRSNDAVANYQTNDFKLFPDTFWNGTDWIWPNGNPPYDQIGQRLMRPNSSSNGGEHWPIRRWISKVTGNLTVHWRAGKASSGGAGVTAKIFHKGGTAKLSALVTSTNFLGTNNTLVLTGVQAGDPIDFVIDPAGTGGASDDTGDATEFDVRIYGNASLTPYVASDIKTQLQNINSSAYVRFPFTVSSAGLFETLSLQLRYDSGFIGYLNGVEVLRRNAPSDPTWNSTSTLERSDADAGVPSFFDISGAKDLLKSGPNVLAFHLLNSSASDSDALLQAGLVGSYVTTDFSNLRYFPNPTPGAANGFGNTNLGPLILDAKHSPKRPVAGESLLVTARVEPSFNPVGPVQLVYRIHYGTETNVTMFDDGKHGDGAAGDSIYGGTIPGTAYQAGNMVRYYIKATDNGTNVSRDPVFVKGKQMPEYWGTVVHNPALTNPLPVFYWFSQTSSAGDSGGVGSIFYNDQFLDNVRFGIHGQSSSGFPKHSFNVDLNAGYKLVWQEGQPAIDDINLLTTYPDKSKMRNMLAYGTFRDAGTAYHFVVPVRVQLNGQFWGDWHMVENGDDNYLKRVGLDPNGALYKMYSTFPDIGSAEKKTRQNEGTGDLTALSAGLALSGAAKTAFVMDNLNVPEVVNYLAGMTMTGNTDCCHKNYYFYRDTEGTAEWQMIPWDVDLSFGRVWSGGPTYWDDTMHVDTPLRIGAGNAVPNAIFENPSLNQMYLRRLRTLMEEQLQPPGTPTHLLKHERFIDEWVPKLAPDGALDLAKWGTFSGDTSSGSAGDSRNKQTVAEAANIIKYEYLPGRRNFLFNSVGEIPKSQPEKPVILIGAIEFNPSSGNQDEEYFTLINTNKVFIDISHWTIRGAVNFTFQGGTVLPTNGTLYVSPNVNAFRARANGPRGGQGLFVQGGYKGHLSARGEAILLVDQAGNTIASTNYVGAPSAAQNSLRITEIMYRPAPAAKGALFETDDYEYLELKNIGASALDLTGVRFVSGIEFNFSNASSKTLGAGQSVLLVHNQAGFTSRYGAGKPIAGEYTGTLSDSGENLRLIDAANEVILDFNYNNSWYPVTEGLGPSLVVVDATASWDTWGQKSNWRPSSSAQGSPGSDDPTPGAIVPVVINEILTHSVTAAQDAVELFNPTAAPASIGNWYLTDDFQSPKKYRFPAGAVVPAGGFLTVTEAQFNAGGAGSFSLSANGDEIYLFSANGDGDLTGYVTGYEFGAALDGVTFGPHVTSQGDIHFTALQTATLGASNSLPKIGPVVISEIMYHPVENADGSQNPDLEYIELRNISDTPVSLFDPAFPTNHWRITGGISFSFPANTVVPARGSLVLVNFDPVADTAAAQAFIARYSQGAPSGFNPTLLGPWAGQLDNSSESLALYQPDAPDTSSGVTPFVLVDWVNYRDSDGWPSLADGFGPALTRTASGASYGNDPANWIAAKPSPGFEDQAGAPPTISVQPASGNPVAGTDVPLAVTAAGAPTLGYQWIHDGQTIAEARSSNYTIPSARILDWGNYQVVVMNGQGATVSSNAVIIVRQPAVIAKQPASRSVLSGTNVTFTVTALGQGKLTYQWTYNNLPITGATTNSLTLRGVTLANEGAYRVVVTDSVGSVTSEAAALVVYDRPVFLSVPQSVSVLPGEDATFYTAISGRGPFNYRWQRASTLRTNDYANRNFSVFTVKGVTTTVTGEYSVVVTNPVGTRITSPTARLSLLTDADNDKMADEWEVVYGLKPNDPSDANLDSDGDGVSNFEEYQAGTDPKDRQSYLKIDALHSDDTGTTVEFFAQSNRTYTVEFKESVTGGLWQTLTNVMISTNNRPEIVTDSYPVSRGRIYRLLTPALVSRPAKTPAILESPNSLRPNLGTPLTLSVLATGKGTLSYQWNKNGQPIPGAVAAALSFGA